MSKSLQSENNSITLPRGLIEKITELRATVLHFPDELERVMSSIPSGNLKGFSDKESADYCLKRERQRLHEAARLIRLQVNAIYMALTMEEDADFMYREDILSLIDITTLIKEQLLEVYKLYRPKANLEGI